MLKTYLNNIVEWSILMAGIFFALIALWLIIEVPYWTFKIIRQIKDISL